MGNSNFMKNLIFKIWYYSKHPHCFYQNVKKFFSRLCDLSGAHKYLLLPPLPKLWYHCACFPTLSFMILSWSCMIDASVCVILAINIFHCHCQKFSFTLTLIPTNWWLQYFATCNAEFPSHLKDNEINATEMAPGWYRISIWKVTNYYTHNLQMYGIGQRNRTD